MQGVAAVLRVLRYVPMAMQYRWAFVFVQIDQMPSCFVFAATKQPHSPNMPCRHLLTMTAVQLHCGMLPYITARRQHGAMSNETAATCDNIELSLRDYIRV